MKKKKQHRGRFQAQGNGTEKSVPWTLVFPITKSHAYSSIDKLKSKLTPEELSIRNECFIKASKFIQRVPSYGITAFFKHSCIPFPPVQDIRVDIDVLAGVAFIDD
jgi:hypothetical protein